MDFVDAFVNAPSAKSRAKATVRKTSPWTDPEADLRGNEALIQANIVTGPALETVTKKIKELTSIETEILLPTIPASPTKLREKPPYPTDGKSYVWNEKKWSWELAEVTTGLFRPGIDDVLTAEQEELFADFEARFEGLTGLDHLRQAIVEGHYDAADLAGVTPAFFNNQTRDAAGLLPGGWSAESGFYTDDTTGGYASTYLTEPSENQASLHNGLKAFHEITTATGETRWVRNPDYVAKGEKGTTAIGGQDSIDKTNLFTDSERNAQLAAAGVESATAILQRLAGAFGLPTTVVAKLKQFMVDGLSEEAISLEIRQTDEYKTRFPGMELRRDAGFGAITEAEYMANEDEYAMLLRTHGLPPRFYDDRMDFANLIAADVSPNEFGERVSLAELATKGADPNTKEELKRLFDVDETDLVAYYLDPESATNLIEERRAFEAAGLSATAARVIGTPTGFDKDTALALQREGVQRREIQQRLTPASGLANAILGEEDGISADDLASSEFGLDPLAANKVRRRREERASNFSGQSGMLISGSGVSGLGVST